ncbi:transmembrane protein, putative [Rhizoctonia solani AG-3 Rhs1AP]|uniref:Transmembrane protein, putative n=1 Tax=Rhizoctonia solani AG-3 Rhs1AP TaxID=1086054 RepID=X8JL15_9AGAM|nr:transmembrane protein, putative [Rhizoctonia solani AG-3 Rhs1AP]
MRLGLVTGLAISSTLVWAYEPRVYLLSTRGMLGGRRGASINPPSLTLPQTNKVLANHLGLDTYESLEDYGESKEWQKMLKNGMDSLFDEPSKNTMMFVLYTDRPQDLASMPTFDYFPEQPSFYINSTLSRRDISALLTNYAAHARQDFTTAPSGLEWHSDSDFASKFEGDDIIETFKVPGKSAALFLDEIMAIQYFRHGSWAQSNEAPNFATFEITALDLLAEVYGRDSAQYRKAVDVIEWLSIRHEGETYSLIVTPKTEPAGHSYHQSRNIVAPIERRAPVPGSLPIYSCFQSADTCANSTSACSGRGSCVSVSRAGRTCYTCKCEPSRSQDGMTTTYWAGQQCERKDVSSAFVLLVGTVLGVLVVAFGSVALLYSVGDEKLPGTLTGGAVHGTKHD